MLFIIQVALVVLVLALLAAVVFMAFVLNDLHKMAKYHKDDWDDNIRRVFWAMATDQSKIRKLLEQIAEEKEKSADNTAHEKED